MFITRPLNSSFDKKSFNCGKDLLDHYLKTQANQDMKKFLAVVFVLGEPPEIQGYYTLSSSSVPKEAVPEDIRKKMPGSYDQLPVILIGRLAIDQRFQGHGLGSAILADALKRCYIQAESTSGAIAVVVDPIDDDAKEFYRQYQFIEFLDSDRMFISMKTIRSYFL